jgi:hypothetical protein
VTESSPSGATPDPVEAQFAKLARSSRRAGLVSVLGLVFLLGSIAYGYVHLRTVQAQIDTKRAELTALEGQLAKADAALKEKQQVLEKITPAALQGLGYKDPYAMVPAAAVSESIDAKRAAERLADPAQRDGRRTITVQYYEKKLDDEVNMRTVLTALEDAGFTLQRKQAQLPGVPTNAIFFGPGARNQDIQLVALTLIGAGIKIRTIEPLLPHVSRPRLIQIGADLRKRDVPPLSVEQILRTTSFTD